MTPQLQEIGAAAFSETSASIGFVSGQLVRDLGRAAVSATMAVVRRSEGASPTARKSAEPSGGEIEIRFDGALLSQVSGMIAALWASRQRNTIFLLVVALIAVVGATAFAQVRLNAWNEPFYDSLGHKNFPEFVQQGLVEDLLAQWLSPLRPFRLSRAGEIGANQRIQEDAKHLTELTTDLSIGLLQSTLLLLSFIGVLWILSDKMVLAMAALRFVPRGSMVWCALIYSGLASLVSWRVGRPLIGLNADRYAREADFRFALVRANEEVTGTRFAAAKRMKGLGCRMFSAPSSRSPSGSFVRRPG